MTNCKNCNEETTNPKFCSKSCSATYNNKKFPKRARKIRFCKYCGIEITKPIGQPSRVTVCDGCNFNFIDWSIITLGECRDKRTHQYNSRVRGLSKRWYDKSDKPKQCIICGYSIHYEVCHIKAINEFDDAAVITEVNALSNLVALCRNHHWEFDSGLIVKADLRAQEDLNSRPYR